MPNPIVRKRIKHVKDKRYIVYDDFIPPYEAGTVNGTPAKIGGKRTVVDTDSKLSIGAAT